METGRAVGTVTGLWRFPVKTMLSERLDEAECTGRGLVGDRAYALIDVETGKVVRAKSVKLFPDLLGCQAAFVEPPRSAAPVPQVRVSLPDGTTVTSDDHNVDQALSDCFRSKVTLARSAPEDFTIDQYHPDVEDADPFGHRDTVVEQKLGSAFFAELDLPSPVPVDAFFDWFPVSVMTTSTLTHLGALQSESRFDERRFRMNVILGTVDDGFVENGWIGKELALGDAVRLRITMPDSRCVMTTLGQEDLPKDSGILRTLARHNRIQIGAAGLFPCAGVYAVVEAPGTIRTGDRATVA